MISMVEIDFARLNEDEILDLSEIQGSSVEDYELNEQYAHMIDIIRFINFHDRDIIYLSFVTHKNQCNIASLLEKTQPAISYDINRLKQKINNVFDFLSVVDTVLNFIKYDSKALTNEDCNLLLLMLYCSSITKVATVLKRHPITCKSRFDKVIRYLDIHFPHISSLYKLNKNEYINIKKTIKL